MVPSRPDSPACCPGCRRRLPQVTPYCANCGQRLVRPEITGKIGDEALAVSPGFHAAGPGVVRDGRTELLWQQGGSLQPLSHRQAMAYAEHLNGQGWGGRQDWRLPALPELAGLLTQEKSFQGIYLDPIFDGRQRFCWSASPSPAGGAYGVLFYPGSILAQPRAQAAYCRAVAGHCQDPLSGFAPASPELLQRGRDLLFEGDRRKVPWRREMEGFLQDGGFLSDVVLAAGVQLYFLPSQEFLQALIRLFRRLGVSRVVEIGAWEGFVAEALRRRGFPVVATDLSAEPGPGRYGAKVYRASHLEALESFRPELAFWCWPPLRSRAPEELIRSRSLKFYLEVGDGGFAASAPGLASRFRGRYLSTLSRLGFTRLDVGSYRHNRCFLFKAGGC